MWLRGRRDSVACDQNFIGAASGVVLSDGGIRSDNSGSLNGSDRKMEFDSGWSLKSHFLHA